MQRPEGFGSQTIKPNHRAMKQKLLFTAFILFAILPGVMGQKYSITLSPAILSFKHPVPQVGFGMDLGQRWNLLAEFAGAHFSDSRLSLNDIKMYRFSGELKWFVSPEGKRSYLSVQQAFTFRQTEKETTGGYYTKEGTLVQYARASLSSPIYSYAVKFGRQFTISRHIFLDLFVGMGGRVIDTRYQPENLKFTTEQIPMKCLIGFRSDDAYLYNYRLHRFHVPMGFRLGYSF